MTKKLRLLVADDHAIVRMGLSALIDSQPDMACVGEALDGNAAVAKTTALKPDIVVMDIMMPELDGIRATQMLTRLPDAPKVLILTTSTSSEDLSHAIRSGASGAIMKSEANAKLLQAIRTIGGGADYLSPEVRGLLSHEPPVADLTERQLDILSSMAKGLTNKDIAGQLNCSSESIKDRINAICTKLGAANRTEAVAIALKKHLLKT